MGLAGDDDVGRLDELLSRAALEAAAVRRLTAELTFVRAELEGATKRLTATKEAIAVIVDEKIDRRFRRLVQP